MLNERLRLAMFLLIPAILLTVNVAVVTPHEVSIVKGLEWLVNASLKDGSWKGICPSLTIPSTLLIIL